MALISDYSNIEKVVSLLQEQKQVNIFLGIETSSDNKKKIFQHVTALRKRQNRYIISGVFKGRYLVFEFEINEDKELKCISQCYEPMYISFTMLNNILHSDEYNHDFYSLFTIYEDIEYLKSLHEGLEYIINLNKLNITFEKDDKVVKVAVNKFYDIYKDKYIYGVTFIDNNINEKSITVYFDMESKEVFYGYLSKFQDNGIRKGFYISRNMIEVIDSIKEEIAMF